MIGAIYALEHIAADSERDHWPIMEILTAYVRKNSPFLPSERDEPCGWKGERSGEAPLDIQAALTVIGRRNESYDPKGAVLDLSLTDLRYAYLMEAKLDRAHFFAANLCGAWLNKASLVGAQLSLAILRDADLRGADLSSVSLGPIEASAGFLKGTCEALAMTTRRSGRNPSILRSMELAC